MAAGKLRRFTVQEALNSVINSDGDALQVDLDNATITAGDLQIDTDDLETAVAATNTKLDAVIVDLAALEQLTIAIKATTDKLDECIDESNDTIGVDVKVSVPVPVS